ncbi:hypothetical protein I316_00096 [Kwoniella heveanensis BCC8398]|uniref:Uncharacterized protein n=1 Tax=Kwoniella heveanensis BCC8398 TaxID=1296120 RepID=A0A1B9H3M2_9TREE|nr:hypothetical protein I316_00096 [Kwoniella heveanensis BCC8398]
MKPRLRLAASARPVTPAARSELVESGSLLPWAGQRVTAASASSLAAGLKRHLASSAAAIRQLSSAEDEEYVDRDPSGVDYDRNEQQRWMEEIPYAESSAMAARRQQSQQSHPSRPSSSPPLPSSFAPRASRRQSPLYSASAPAPSAEPSTTTVSIKAPSISIRHPYQSKKPSRPAPSASPQPSLAITPTSTRRPTPASYIYEALRTPNPPPPADFLTFLRAHSHTLTYAAGLTLAKYAERVDDQKALRGVWREMVSNRIAPLGAYKSFVAAQRIRRKRLTSGNPALRTSSVKVSRSTEAVTEGELEEAVVDGYFGSTEKPAQRAYAVERPNRWAMKMYPPLESIPRDFDWDQLVRHLHFLLLERSAPGFEDAMELLTGCFGHQGETGDAMKDDNRVDKGLLDVGDRIDGLQGDRTRIRNGYKAMALLNLYLTYLPATRQSNTANIDIDMDPLDLIDAYLETAGSSNMFESIIGKQTLHLSVRALIDLASTEAEAKAQIQATRRSTSLPVVEKSLIDQRASTIGPKTVTSKSAHSSPSSNFLVGTSEHTYPTAKAVHAGRPGSGNDTHSPEQQQEPVAITTSAINRILATISHFRSAHAIYPGPETYRHLALFALAHDLKDQVGLMAYEGWFKAFESLQRRASAEQDDRGVGVTVGGRERVEEVRFRFRRVGSTKRRWKRVLGMLEEKGWIRKVSDDVEDGSSLDGGVNVIRDEEEGNVDLGHAVRGGGLGWGYEWIRSRSDQVRRRETIAIEGGHKGQAEADVESEEEAWEAQGVIPSVKEEVEPKSDPLERSSTPPLPASPAPGSSRSGPDDDIRSTQNNFRCVQGQNPSTKFPAHDRETSFLDTSTSPVIPLSVGGNPHPHPHHRSIQTQTQKQIQAQT